jgi:heme oxygenase
MADVYGVDDEWSGSDWAGMDAADQEDAGGTVFNYHFPVHIEVMGALDDAAMKAVGEHVFRELTRELDSRQ